MAPEAGSEGQAPPPARVKVYFNGSEEPAIEIRDHHLDYLFRGGRPVDPPPECVPELTPSHVGCAEPACLGG